MADLLSAHDLSSARAALVASIPGRHTGGAERVGQARGCVAHAAIGLLSLR